jgi:transcriptional regulator with XRE-family HTH domain
VPSTSGDVIGATVYSGLQTTLDLRIMDTTGARLREARQAAGISLAALAGRTHYSKSYLGLIETGCRTATADVVLAYERELGDLVDRRGLLTGLAASVVAPAAVSELIRTGFAAALDGHAASDEWQERAIAYGVDYMTVGAAEIQNRLARDLVILQQHLDQPQLWGVAARLLTTFGKTATDRKEAVKWYRLAAATADRSGDLGTRVWVRGRSALALAYEAAELPTARQLAAEAVGLSDKPTLGRLNALVAQAHIAGVRGDAKTALTTLDDARRVFDVAGSDEQISDFAVPEWRFHTFASMLLSRLGDPRAVDEQEAADHTRPATLPRFATHIELHRGLMLARSGDIAGGIEYARNALDRLPPERHSLSLRLMMAEVEKTTR